MNKSISRRIRHFRKLRKITQGQLSKSANINLRHLQRIEAGIVQLSTKTLVKIAGALNLPTLLLSDHTPHKCEKLHNFRCCVEHGILDLLPTPISVVDRDGLIIYTNKAHAIICGKSSLEVDGQFYCWDFAQPQIKDMAREYFIKNTGDPQCSPIPFFGKNLLPNGEIIDVRVDWSRLTENDNVITILCIVTKLPPPLPNSKYLSELIFFKRGL